MFKISVVTPVGEWKKYVLPSIKSVLKQGKVLGELILVDNAISPLVPKGRPIFDIVQSDARIKLVRSDKPLSPAYARNLGMQSAIYDYIAVLDSDDEYLPGHLDRGIDMLRTQDADIYFCSYFNREINGSGAIITPNTSFDIPNLIKNCSLGHSTAIFRSALNVNYPEIGLRHDYALWLKLAKRKPSIRYVYSDVLGVVRNKRKGSLSSSVSKLRLLFKQCKVTLLFSGLNTLHAMYLQTFFIINKLKKVL